MHLHHITISGFKSFAKKSELSFTTPVTAIVGPNGSGKSNVVEAFRFVLGEQSVKSLRGTKGEDLIFNGSPKAARANRASVAVTFDNTKKILPLDFDEVIIERVVHRDGANEYSINNARVRLRDVQELLAAANIGPSGHHIISQGEADRILSARPQQRREMIEDALGLKVYQFKKAEAQRKLAKTVDNIAHVEALRKEGAPHLRFLKRQVAQAQRAQRIKEELVRLYNQYLRREEVYLSFHTKRLEEVQQAPHRKRQELLPRIAAAKEKAEAAPPEKEEEIRACKNALLRTTQTREAHVRELGVLEGKIAVLEQQRAAPPAAEGEEPPVARTKVRRAVDALRQALAPHSDSSAAATLYGLLKDTLASFEALLAHAPSASGEAHRPHTAGEYDACITARTSLERTLRSLEAKEDEQKKQYDALMQEQHQAQHRHYAAQQEVFVATDALRTVEQELSRIQNEQHVLSRDREEFSRELQEAAVLLGASVGRYYEVPVVEQGRTLTDADIATETRTVQLERRRTLEKMKIRLEELGTHANDEILKEYKDATARDEFLAAELADLHGSVEKLHALMTELSAELDTRFAEGIEKISAEFERLFVLMFGGGTARLVLSRRHRAGASPSAQRPHDNDSTDKRVDAQNDESADAAAPPEEEGVEVDVSLPNKRVRGLAALSGGERALTSTALIFAMSRVYPPPFVVLDETDAALDEANSRRYTDMITELAKRSQLVLITHNRQTMAGAGVLYGVTMGADGISKLLSVQLDTADEAAATAPPQG